MEPLNPNPKSQQFIENRVYEKDDEILFHALNYRPEALRPKLLNPNPRTPNPNSISD